MTGLRATSSRTIRANARAVWRALTTPDVIKKWFFGVDTESEWKVGSPIVHRGEYQGKPYVDKGVILRFEPPHLLVHTHWSVVSGRPDLPENYQEVAWMLTGDGETQTQLTVIENNLPSEATRRLSEESWNLVLQNLKEHLESR